MYCRRSLTPAPAPPRRALRVTLRQAVDIALKRDLKLKQQTEAIAEAEARLREKQTEYGPRLQFDYTIWTWHGLFVDTSVADPGVPTEGTGRAQMTLLLPVWVARRAREAAVHQAMQEVKDEVVRMTITASERLMREKMDDERHRQMVGRFLDDLEKN